MVLQPKGKFTFIFEMARLSPTDSQLLAIIRDGLATGLQWWPPVEKWQYEFAQEKGLDVMVNLTANVEALKEMKKWFQPCLDNPDVLKDEFIGDPLSVRVFVNEEILKGIEPSLEFLNREIDKLNKFGAVNPGKAYLCPIGEFDSASLPSTGFLGVILLEKRIIISTREGGYNAMKDWLLAMSPLKVLVDMPPQKRNYTLVAATGFGFTCHWAYEWGFDLVMLERHNDCIGDLWPGICFARGAGNQYGRPWGIDMSKYRVTTWGATLYDQEMRLMNGWSPSYTFRHWILSYMAGADLLRQEQAVIGPGYEDGFLYVVDKKTKSPKTTPVGNAALEFANFYRKKCVDRGHPWVPVGLLMDYYHSWSPERLVDDWVNGEGLWYGSVPFEEGDYQTRAFLNAAFPGCESSSLNYPSPWYHPQQKESQKRMLEYFSENKDIRPYEPMSNTTFGDVFDVILSNASEDVLKRYPIILALGNIEIKDELAKRLKKYVEGGGKLIANVCQVSPSVAESLFGVVTKGKDWIDAYTANCRICGTKIMEPNFRYASVDLLPGTISLADTPFTKTWSVSEDTNMPIVTSRNLGQGHAIFTSQHYLVNITRRMFSSTVLEILEHFLERPVKVIGPLCHYGINSTGDSRWLVTVANHQPIEWSGTLEIADFIGNSIVNSEELISGERLICDGKKTVLSIPPYSVKVVKIETASAKNPLKKHIGG